MKRKIWRRKKKEEKDGEEREKKNWKDAERRE